MVYLAFLDDPFRPDILVEFFLCLLLLEISLVCVINLLEEREELVQGNLPISIGIKDLTDAI